MFTAQKTFTLCSIQNISLLRNIKIQQKIEYECLYKKDDESKGDNITNGNQGIIHYGDGFISCKVFHDRHST